MITNNEMTTNYNLQANILYLKKHKIIIKIKSNLRLKIKGPPKY